AYGEMTVTAFLQFVARARGFSGSEVQNKADAAMERLNLRHVKHQVIDTLSKGYKRRVGLAQAILHDPAILILDEPTDGLDPNQKHEVRSLIQDMAAEKIIVVSTHILEEVQAVCNRAMIIADGRLLLDDTPAGLLSRSRYHNAVTLVVDDLQKAASVLSELPQARKVEIRDGELTIFPDRDAALFQVVSDRVREQGWRVHELRLEQGRMDEVFRQVTTAEVPS
ncbi:MAG TPA: ABC transporter ATP-binding protein, partial [Xanthomonadales bacterium]|nr:ABC transporter ATP-binding protein [Xanthomonadales bacterium]